MAVKTSGRKLSEAELNAPDLDDEGRLDVEHYPVPDGSDIDDPYLREVWAEAVKILGDDDDLQECGGEGGKPGPCPEGHADNVSAIHRAYGSLSAKAKAAVDAAHKHVTAKYADLESKFGRKGAIGIMAASVAMLAVPVPGSSLAPYALARAYMALKGQS